MAQLILKLAPAPAPFCQKRRACNNLGLYKPSVSSSTNTVQISSNMRYAMAARNNARRILPTSTNQQQIQGQTCNIRTRYYQASGKNILISRMVCIGRSQAPASIQSLTNFPLYQIPGGYTPIAGGFQRSIVTREGSNIITNYTYLQMVTNGLIDPNNPFQQNFPLVTFTNTTNNIITYQTPTGFTEVPGGFINYNYNNNGISIVVMVITDPNMITSTNPSNIINII